MELRYTYVIIIGTILSIIIILLTKRQKETYKSGSKIANTSYVKKSDIYKKLLKQYHIRIFMLYILISISILSSLFLISRPSKTDVSDTEAMNRDIMLCMDVSASVDELNTVLVDTLKDTVNNLKGERFGITIFNSSSVKLVPLTDDYDYILEVLDIIHKALSQDDDELDNDEYLYLNSYITSGTIEGENGSSLIGDGLAACTFNLPEDEDRTRLIIFSTDNELAGNPLVTLDKAADIAAARKVRVYGIGPDFIQKKLREEMEAAIKKTGGKYYNQKDKDTVKSIVDDIESTSKSLLKGISSTKQTDQPIIPFIILIVSLLGVFIISKKVVK